MWENSSASYLCCHAKQAHCQIVPFTHFLLRDDVPMEITRRCSEKEDERGSAVHVVRGTRGHLVSGLCMSDPFIDPLM